MFKIDQWVRVLNTESNIIIMRIGCLDNMHISGWGYRNTPKRTDKKVLNFYRCDIPRVSISDVTNLIPYWFVIPQRGDLVIDVKRNIIEQITSNNLTCEVNGEIIDIVETTKEMYLKIHNLLFITNLQQAKDYYVYPRLESTNALSIV